MVFAAVVAVDAAVVGDCVSAVVVALADYIVVAAVDINEVAVV